MSRCRLPLSQQTSPPPGRSTVRVRKSCRGKRTGCDRATPIPSYVSLQARRSLKWLRSAPAPTLPRSRSSPSACQALCYSYRLTTEDAVWCPRARTPSLALALLCLSLHGAARPDLSSKLPVFGLAEHSPRHACLLSPYPHTLLASPPLSRLLSSAPLPVCVTLFCHHYLPPGTVVAAPSSCRRPRLICCSPPVLTSPRPPRLRSATPPPDHQDLGEEAADDDGDPAV